MIGIVLWSDATTGKAVIWCEDQGDLAFYSHVGTFETSTIHVGDWVFFDLKLENDLRLALNIEVLAEPGCPSLAEGLAPLQDAPKKAASLPLAEQGDLPRDSVFRSAPAKARPAARKTSAAALMAERTAVGAKVHESLPDREPGNGLVSTAATQNVIAFPRKGDDRLRRA